MNFSIINPPVSASVHLTLDPKQNQSVLLLAHHLECGEAGESLNHQGIPSGHHGLSYAKSMGLMTTGYNWGYYHGVLPWIGNLGGLNYDQLTTSRNFMKFPESFYIPCSARICLRYGPLSFFLVHHLSLAE